MIASSSPKLKVEQRRSHGGVTIDNPAANTWDTESLPALRELVQALNAGAERYLCPGAHRCRREVLLRRRGP
jgi:hypothetical protein